MELAEFKQCSCRIREIHLPLFFSLADLPIAELRSVNVEGHITMDIHEERLPIGRMILVKASLEFQRLGRFSIAEPICTIESSELVHESADAEDQTDGPI